MTEGTGLAVRDVAVFEIDLAAILLRGKPGKDARSRIGMFLTWHDEAGLPWWQPRLDQWRDAMLEAGASASTVSGRLSTVRSRYKTLGTDNGIRQRLLISTPAGWGFGDRAAFVNETLKQLDNDLDVKNARVKVSAVQDRTDRDQVRLTIAQAEALMSAPSWADTLKGKRDAALLALALCTGVREFELQNLVVDDLRQRYQGELALLVKHGKGDKQRMIPYGELSWCLLVVDAWLDAAGIDAGPVFRSFWKGARTLRPGRLSLRAIQKIVRSYPVTIDGELVEVRPHDLRRTYACTMWACGMDLISIQRNLGHASSDTTLGYIGDLTAAQRRGKAAYTFDLSALRVQGVLPGIAA